MANASEIPSEWYFITAPQNVTWSKSSKMQEVDTYATNNPYVHYGSTGLRDLSLNDCMIEGFSDNKQVEQNVIDLEACMRVVLETDDGYAAPFCWEVYAGGKMYGVFILDQVNITEEIRDNAGMAARAKADLQLKEVSPYQVNAGIDLTAEALTGNLSEETQKQLMEKQENQADKQDQAAKDKNKNDGKDKDKNGSGSSSNSGSNSSGGNDQPVTDANWEGGTSW